MPGQSGVRSRLMNSAISAGEDAFVITATSGWSTTGPIKPPLIFCHGAGQNTAIGIADDVQMRLLKMLGEFFCVCFADLGGSGAGTAIGWGNVNHVARIESVRTFLASAFGSTGPVTLVGVSMGGGGALNYANTYPANTRAMIGLIPALDWADLHDNRGYSTQIDAAYSGGADTSYRTTRNPVVFASTMDSSIPILLNYASDDLTTVPSTMTAFQAARPTNTTLVNYGAVGGHSATTVGYMDGNLLKFARNLTL